MNGKIVTYISCLGLIILALAGCDFKRDGKPVKPITGIRPEVQCASVISLSLRRTEKEGIVPLTVIVDNLSSPDAPVVVGVYGPENRFPDTRDKLKEYRLKPRNGKFIARIKDLQYGEFALAVYQDINGDGKIDRNLIGIPREPFAFSNNYRPVTKAPSFRDCKFSYNSSTNTINISLLKINII
jgi:uncharacterized protein (DUF2141 family)